MGVGVGVGGRGGTRLRAAEHSAPLPSYKHQRGIILTAAAFQFTVTSTREALLVQVRLHKTKITEDSSSL